MEAVGPALQNWSLIDRVVSLLLTVNTILVQSGVRIAVRVRGLFLPRSSKRWKTSARTSDLTRSPALTSSLRITTASSDETILFSTASTSARVSHTTLTPCVLAIAATARSFKSRGTCLFSASAITSPSAPNVPSASSSFGTTTLATLIHPSASPRLTSLAPGRPSAWVTASSQTPFGIRIVP